MHTGSRSTHRSIQYMGIHQLLRCLSNLLRKCLPSSTLRHLVDWFGSSVPLVFHRYFFRQSNGCWLLPARHAGGYRPAAFGCFCDLLRYRRLALVLVARHMHWARERLTLSPGLFPCCRNTSFATEPLRSDSPQLAVHREVWYFLPS